MARTWLYPANARIPSEKAHVYQIFQMIDALERAGVDVELIHPARANIRQLEGTDPANLYGLSTSPRTVALPTLDLVRLVTIDAPRLNRTPFPQAAFALQSATFAAAAAVHCRRASQTGNVIYGRDWPILAACKLASPAVPVVWEAHDLPESSIAGASLNALLPRLDGVVAIASGLRDALVAKGVAHHRILVAPDAVDLRRFEHVPTKDAARLALGLPADAPIVVYTGHLYRWKGAHTLALASRYLSPETQVCIVGGAPADLEEFREFVAAERLDGVLSPGYVSPAQVPLWLAAADVLALPNSAQETISARYTSPLKLFEYLASRRAIIASDLPSLREVLEHDVNALLVPPDDPAALAAGIRALLDDPGRAERLAECAWHDVQGRTWDARARAIVGFVEAMIDRHSPVRER